MLAEIFIVQLEAAARAAADATPPCNSRFLPFIGGGQFVFKDRGKRLAAPARAEASTSPFRSDEFDRCS